MKKSNWWILTLFILWAFYGLVGHSPWKPDEGYSLGLIHSMAKTGDYVVPMLAGEPFMEKPPLYYWMASFLGSTIKIFPFHDAARLTSGIFTCLTLLFLCLSVREVFNRASVWLAILLFISAPGWCVYLHYLITDVALLTGFAMSLYGACLSQRLPRLGGFVLGTGLGVGFLSKGLLIVGVWGIVAVALLCLRDFRNKNYWKTTFWTTVSFLPWFVIWPCALLGQDYELFMSWFWKNNLGRFFGFGGGGPTQKPYLFIKTLPLVSGPAFFGMLYYFYVARKDLWSNRPVRIALIFFVSCFTLLSTASVNGRGLYGMPLILPVIFFGAEGFYLLEINQSLRNFLTKFLLILCGCIASFLWVLWLGLYFNVFPGCLILERMGLIHGEWKPVFHVGFFSAAVFLTVCSIAMMFAFRNVRHNWLIAWSVSVVLVWGLVMTLWCPFLDAKKGYNRVFADMSQHLPDSQTLYSIGFGESQRAILDYYQGIQTKRLDNISWGTLAKYRMSTSFINVFLQFEALPAESYLLIQGFMADEEEVFLSKNWKCLWKGGRWRDMRECYWLLQKIGSP